MLVKRTNVSSGVTQIFDPQADRWVSSRLPIRSMPCFSMIAASFTALLRLRRSMGE